MRPPLTAALLLAALAWMSGVCAQEKINTAAIPPPPPEEHAFDPLRAAKSLEVGRYYLNKHNYDAAIERFLDAAKAKENFAEPYLLLGAAYEQKGDKTGALKALETYLKILPMSPEADKVRKHIERLKREIAKESRAKSR